MPWVDALPDQPLVPTERRAVSRSKAPTRQRIDIHIERDASDIVLLAKEGAARFRGPVARPGDRCRSVERPGHDAHRTARPTGVLPSPRRRGRSPARRLGRPPHRSFPHPCRGRRRIHPTGPRDAARAIADRLRTPGAPVFDRLWQLVLEGEDIRSLLVSGHLSASSGHLMRSDRRLTAPPALRVLRRPAGARRRGGCVSRGGARGAVRPRQPVRRAGRQGGPRTGDARSSRS